jgi:hypothetical protein
MTSNHKTTRRLITRIGASAVFVASFLYLASLGCNQKYSMSPLAAPVPTLTPTVTFTPPAGPNAACALVPIHDLTGDVNHGPVLGDTTTSSNNFNDYGNGSDAPDDLYVFTVFQTAYYNFAMCGGSNWDSFLYLRTQCGDPGTTLASDDDGCGSNLSQIYTILDPGVYYLIVDGLGSSAAPYELRVTAGPTPTPEP